MKHLHKHYGKRPLWHWFLLYFIVGGIAYAAFYTYYNGNSSYSPSHTSPTTTQKTTTTTKSSNNSTPVTSVETMMSYQDALATYGSKRIQFNENCVATPTTMSLTKGTSIMLDNRASKERIIYVDGAVYDIAAYGFKIAKLTTSATLPYTMSIDCGTGKGNAKIILQ